MVVRNGGNKTGASCNSNVWEMKKSQRARKEQIKSEMRHRLKDKSKFKSDRIKERERKHRFESLKKEQIRT